MALLLFVGGGSIGHIAPAVAVARALTNLNPLSTIHFVCSRNGEDETFLMKEGIHPTCLDAPRLSLRFPWRFFHAYRRSLVLLETLHPQAIFSKGGYVSLPVCFAAHSMGIPIVLHESDVVSGYANWLVGHWATDICLGFPDAAKHKAQVHITGNPIRPGVDAGKRADGLLLTGLSGNRPILLIMGGSQGAETLNAFVRTHFNELLTFCDIIHLTGHGKAGVQGQRSGYWTRAFAHEEIRHLYAASAFSLSRAGASAIAELSANGIPSVLVPLRGAAHDHQYANALKAEGSGGCTVIQQRDMEKVLLPTLRSLAQDSVLRQTMGVKMRSLSHPDAALQIAKVIARHLAPGE
ncbi:MAG: UDP-N-acetylglucosamine--N-acetylmuramyl-(pentapeptide) pyrophosphoryl-undecaprenol N-acetylglucosamine transferase [Candidatus Peribacteraceae bacterium]|nr:UDP-N-acetylglucosamine--N-acetylmuramyl-(pentapeptide) pyrophosphoryl-undecaprenol N-acetylglucosamine transferase [Candidatus Peribacteraceae bacterium]